MTHDEAVKLLSERLPSARALEILDAVDPQRYEIFGVEGFLRRPDGMFESSLNLIFDLSMVQNLSIAEKAEFIRTFVRNRISGHTFFEVYGDKIR